MPLSSRLFLSLCIEDSRSTHPVPSGSGWVQGPRREETRSLFPCALPTEHHPQRSSDPKLRRHRRRQRWGQGRLRDSAWAPAPGASFRSHKGGNGSQKGSAWSRSPSEEVGVGNRTRVLATPGPQGIASLEERLRADSTRVTERW